MKSVLLLTSSLVPVACFAFPIAPVPLRQLIEHSDLIIVAQVEPPAPKKKDRGSPFDLLFGTSPAYLRPLLVLKGTPAPGLVTVHFDPNMTCPSPPRFTPGSNVLAFLKENTPSHPFRSTPLKDADIVTNGYETIALDYGAKELSAEELRAYSRMIQEYLQVAAERDNEQKLQKTTEWLVKCTENSHTRWEGAYELAGTVNQLYEKQTNQFAPYLTPSHIARLSNVLFRAEFIKGGEWDLIRMFQDTAKPQVLRLLLGYLDKANRIWLPMHPKVRDDDSFPHPWNVYDAMHRVADLLNSKDAKAFVEKYKRTDFFAAETRVTATSKFLEIIKRHRGEPNAPPN